jgi:hypothetical protein
MLTAFVALGASGQPLYASPRVDSDYAYVVDAPLPLGFTVTAESVSTVRPEVVAVDETLEAFGYVSHGFEVVDTVDFYLAVFVDDAGELVFPSYHLEVDAETTPGVRQTLFAGDVEAGIGHVRLRSVEGAYRLRITAEDYQDQELTLTHDELRDYETTPLVVVLGPALGELTLRFPEEYFSAPEESAPEESADRDTESAPAAPASDLDSVPRLSVTSGPIAEDGADGERVFAVCTIVDTASGDVVVDRQPFELVAAQGDEGQPVRQITIVLETGDYEITELFITRGPMLTERAAPVAGSTKAAEVGSPLPIEFTVQQGEATVQEPETLPIGEVSAPAFGYSELPEIEARKVTLMLTSLSNTGHRSFCHGDVFVSLDLCQENCDEPESWLNACQLVGGYQGTAGYRKLCPQMTPPRELNDCTGMPQLALPLGYAQYKVHARKRLFRPTQELFVAEETSRWSSSHREYFDLEASDDPALVVVSADEQEILFASTGLARSPNDVLDFGEQSFLAPASRSVVVRNDGRAPLELSALAIEGDQFVVDGQDETIVLGPGGQAELVVAITPMPEGLAEQAGILSFTHNDPWLAWRNNHHEAQLGLRVTRRGHYVESPVFYSECDSEAALTSPFFGAEYGPTLSRGTRGGYTGQNYEPHKFGNGFRVYCCGRTDGDSSWATLSPFGPDVTVEREKPDLAVGTLSFWASTDGGWRGAGRNLHQDALFRVSLAPGIALTNFVQDKNTPSLSLTVDGRVVYSQGTREATPLPYVLQWDFVHGFADGTNVRLYHDGALRTSATSVVTAEQINGFVQQFYLRAYTDRTGDNRACSHASIDNIAFYDAVVDSW